MNWRPGGGEAESEPRPPDRRKSLCPGSRGQRLRERVPGTPDRYPELNVEAGRAQASPQDYPVSQPASHLRGGAGASMPVAQVPFPDRGESAGPGTRTPGRVGTAGTTFLTKFPRNLGTSAPHQITRSPETDILVTQPHGRGRGASLLTITGVFKPSCLSIP